MVYLFAELIFLPVAGCGGAQYARDKGIPVVLFPKSKDEPDGLSPTDLVTALRSGSFPESKTFWVFICHIIWSLLMLNHTSREVLQYLLRKAFLAYTQLRLISVTNYRNSAALAVRKH